MFRRSTAGLLAAGLALALAPGLASALSPAPPDIEGVDWRLVQIAGSGVPVIDVPPDVLATLRIDGTQAGGDGGCNSWFAGVQVGAESIAFGPVGSTMMACEEPRMGIEAAYLGWLDDVTAWSVADGVLTLSDANGASLLTFVMQTAPVAPLEGTDWRATRVVVDGQLEPVPADVEVTLRLDGSQASGIAACNRYFGPYTLDGVSLVLGPLGSTEMACEEPRMTFEAAYLAALGATTTFQFSADQLVLLDAAGTTLVTLGVPDTEASPAGAWQLAEIAGGGVVARVQSDATVVFGADGSLSGNTGCNNLMGDYAVEGATIKVGPVATTKMACADEELAATETALLSALESATGWSIDPEGWLVLTDGQGALLAAFTPAPATAA